MHLLVLPFVGQFPQEDGDKRQKHGATQEDENKCSHLNNIGYSENLELSSSRVAFFRQK